MDIRDFGDTDRRSSALTYGAMSIRNDAELANGVAPSLLHALECGVNVIDTARIYQGSEEIVRQTLREWRGPRPMISTKLASAKFDAFRWPCPMAEAYTPQTIRKSVEESLSALGVDQLDIVHLHQWHYLWTLEPAWLHTLHDLRQEGKVGLIAISAQDHEHDAALTMIEQCKIDCIQLILNVFESRPLNAAIPMAAAQGVAVIARCALDSGGLSNTLSQQDFSERAFLKGAPFGQYRDRLDRLLQDCKDFGAESVAELALRFAAFAPGVSTITLGCSTRSMVDAAVKALAKGPLSEEATSAIRRRHVWTKNFYESLV